MGDANVMKILQSKQDLAEILPTNIFREFTVITYGIKKISSLYILHHKEQILWWLDDFVCLYKERVAYDLHYFNFSADSLNVSFLFDPLLI